MPQLCAPLVPGVSLASFPHRYRSICICWFDSRFRSYHPCYTESSWEWQRCSTCRGNGMCEKKFDRDVEGSGEADQRCLCHPNFNYCVLEAELEEFSEGMETTPWPRDLEKFWTDIETTSETDAEDTFEGMTDAVAITAKKKDNLVFQMAELSPGQRYNLSYTRQELLRLCSFNREECDIERQFQLFQDPVFGNCYTFNFNHSEPLTISRAGATYGLRIMMYANLSEYLPTTEESGVRIAIHDKSQVPFPDAVGYSSPTGMMSSLGIRLKKFKRLPIPYGECVDPSEKPDFFIYDNFDYSVEGCHRSCFQWKVIDECGCSDPRFPTPDPYLPCAAANATARNCLETVIEGMSSARELGCQCLQPCKESYYEVSFSASKWPSGAAKIGNCRRDDWSCIERYGRNAAMLQIYYEALSFEMLTESEAYGLEALLADLGGQLGLWMGISIISVVEVIILFINLFYAWRYEKTQRQGRFLLNSGLLMPFSMQLSGESLPCACDCPCHDQHRRDDNHPVNWRHDPEKGLVAYLQSVRVDDNK